MPVLETRTRICRTFFQLFKLRQLSSTHRDTFQKIEESVQKAVAVKEFHHIPELLTLLKKPHLKPNPFGFLSTFNNDTKIQIVDEMLQSFISIRPRFQLHLAYSFLLFHTLEGHHVQLPLALAILQCMLRSGSRPNHQTRHLISDAWVKRTVSASSILLQMHSIGYNVDCGICNYLISSLCAVNLIPEAIELLREMKASCPPDSNSYNIVIFTLCYRKQMEDALILIKEMVSKAGLVPKQWAIVKVAKAILENKNAYRAVELVDLLEKEVGHVDFETYELAVKTCLDCHEYFLSGKVITGMTRRGYIPHLDVRQNAVEGLTRIGEWEMACSVRKLFWDLGS